MDFFYEVFWSLIKFLNIVSIFHDYFHYFFVFIFLLFGIFVHFLFHKIFSIQLPYRFIFSSSLNLTTAICYLLVAISLLLGYHPHELAFFDFSKTRISESHLIELSDSSSTETSSTLESTPGSPNSVKSNSSQSSHHSKTSGNSIEEKHQKFIRETENTILQNKCNIVIDNNTTIYTKYMPYWEDTVIKSGSRLFTSRYIFDSVSENYILAKDPSELTKVFLHMSDASVYFLEKGRVTYSFTDFSYFLGREVNHGRITPMEATRYYFISHGVKYCLDKNIPVVSCLEKPQEDGITFYRMKDDTEKGHFFLGNETPSWKNYVPVPTKH